MQSTTSFLRIFRVELCNYPAQVLLVRYTKVLTMELASRNRFCFPANRFHRNQRRQNLRNLIHDLRLLKAMVNDTRIIQDGKKPYIEGATDPSIFV